MITAAEVHIAPFVGREIGPILPVARLCEQRIQPLRTEESADHGAAILGECFPCLLDGALPEWARELIYRIAIAVDYYLWFEHGGLRSVAEASRSSETADPGWGRAEDRLMKRFQCREG